MTCEECLAVIEDHIEGEFAEPASQRVTAHLSVCAECAAVCKGLRNEQEIYSRYLLDVKATPALWDALRAGIEKEKAVRASRPLARLRGWLTSAVAAPRASHALTAVLLLFAAGLGAAAFRFFEAARPDGAGALRETAARRGGTEVVEPAPGVSAVDKPRGEERHAAGEPRVPAEKGRAAPAGDQNGPRVRARVLPAVGREGHRLGSKRPGPAGREPTLTEVVLGAEKQYRAAISLLSRDVTRRRPSLEPQVLAQFKDALGLVDRAIAETRAAALRQPDDPVAVQYLLTAYARKLDLLREMAAS